MNYIKIDVNGVLKTDKQLLPMAAGDTNSIVILTVTPRSRLSLFS